MYPVPLIRSGQSALHAALLLQPARMPTTTTLEVNKQADASFKPTGCRRTAISKPPSNWTSIEANFDRDLFLPEAPVETIGTSRSNHAECPSVILYAKRNILPILTVIHLECEHCSFDTKTMSWEVPIQSGTDKPHSTAEMKNQIKL